MANNDARPNDEERECALVSYRGSLARSSSSVSFPLVMRRALIHFLRTGELGPLNRTLCREDVRRLLGDPLQWDGREALSTNWRYEGLTVDFDEDHRVAGYGLGFHPSQRIPSCVDSLEGGPYIDISMEEVRVVLKREAICFEEGQWSGNLRTKAGVWINEGNNGKIMSMVYACPGSDGLSVLDRLLAKKDVTYG
jgi:hypothetical protein